MNRRTVERRKGKENFARYLLTYTLNIAFGLAFVTYAFLNSATFVVG